MSNLLTLFFELLVAHCLCDYPLQGDFLARGKNHRNPLPGIPWYQCLFAHAVIHGGAVFLVTGSVWFGLTEVLLHSLTDYVKSEGWISFNQDQALHLVTKAVYVLLLGI